MSYFQCQQCNRICAWESREPIADQGAEVAVKTIANRFCTTPECAAAERGVNGTPLLIGAEPAPELVPKNAVAIAQVPIELPPGANVFELKLREPGIVRGCGFWVCEPKVVASAMRGVQKLLMPLLWVECDPHGAISPITRVFAFVPSDRPFEPKPGWQARYVATAVGERGAMHLLELVEVQ